MSYLFVMQDVTSIYILGPSGSVNNINCVGLITDILITSVADS